MAGGRGVEVVLVRWLVRWLLESLWQALAGAAPLRGLFLRPPRATLTS